MSVTTAAPATPSPAAAARTRLLLSGPIVPTLLRLSAPNLVVNVVPITVTTSVDAHFAGRLGPATLAGIAPVFPLLMPMQQMATFSMGGALAAAVARAIGAGRREDAAALAVHGLIVALVLAALARAIRIAWIAARLAVLATGVIGLAALGYAFIGMNTLTQAFQAMGQTWFPSSTAGVIGLAIVTALGLAVAGGIIAVAFWLGMRRKLGGSP